MEGRNRDWLIYRESYVCFASFLFSLAAIWVGPLCFPSVYSILPRKQKSTPRSLLRQWSWLLMTLLFHFDLIELTIRICFFISVWTKHYENGSQKSDLSVQLSDNTEADEISITRSFILAWWNVFWIHLTAMQFVFIIITSGSVPVVFIKIRSTSLHTLWNIVRCGCNQLTPAFVHVCNVHWNWF